MLISAFGATDRGRKRSKNEDDLAIVDLEESRTLEEPSLSHFEVASAGVLVAVCDGVGGHKAGEIASALALSRLAEEMDAIADGCPRRTLFGEAIERVNRAVWDKAHEDPRLAGMATTLTAAVLCRSRAVIAHVGDSRAYMVRGGAIRQLTRDQSFVQSLVSAGALKPEDAEHSPFRHVILQAIGRQKTVEVALDAVDLAAGDTLVLCTDGLSEKVRPDEIARAAEGDLRAEVQRLIGLANERGGDDNITVLLARIETAADATAH